MLEEFQEIDGFGASTSGRALLQDDSSERIAGVGSGLFALTFIRCESPPPMAIPSAKRPYR